MAENRKNDHGYRIVLAGFRGGVRILAYILAAVILIYLGKRSYTIGYQVVNTAPMSKENPEEVTVIITDEMSVSQIGRLLDDSGLIREDPVSFLVQEFLSEYHNRILPGTYVLNTGMTVDEILKTISGTEAEEQEMQP